MTSGGGLTLAELARELGVDVAVVGDAHVRVTGVHHDSRRVAPGDLFAARKGQKSDGTQFVATAIERGARAIMVQGAPLADVDVPQLIVGDMSTALPLAAAAVYGHPAFSLDIVGITGTNGKTTTSHLVRAAVDGAEGRAACGVIGTLGHSFADTTVPAEHTTPEGDELARVLDAFRARGATHAVMEVSSIALALGRASAIRFRVAAFTNLTQDHLDFHGTMEAYGAAKARLFTEAGPGVSVINVDDPFGAQLVGLSHAPVIRVSARVGASAAEAEVAPITAELDRRSMRATFRTPNGEVHVATRLVGRHNLENLALVLGIVCALELDVTRAAEGLSRTSGVPGRLERCDDERDDIVALVDYAHTPDALARALEASRGITEGRLVCVFGCGGDRDATKRGPMGEIAARAADVVIVTSDNPRSEDPRAIADAAAAGARDAGLTDIDPAALREAKRGLVVEIDRARAIRLAIASAKAGDCVLVAGKGHEDYQIIGTRKLDFDDRVHTREALAARRNG